jgi:ribose 5-phosphate isomerase B
MNNSIPIGCDHAGFKLKNHIINHLEKKGYSTKDYGCYTEESIDYPDFGHPVANHITNNEETKGILICGSGNGINMTANKHQAIRSALCWNKEVAVLSREHNDANIIALPARFISNEEAIEIVDAFFNTDFEGGRHERRVNKISCA